MTRTERLLIELGGHLASAAILARPTQARSAFQEVGFVKVGFLVPASLKARVGEEARALVAGHGLRRDVAFAETGHTPRRMRNVRRGEIHQYETVVPAVYSCAGLYCALGRVAGENVLECPYESEQYVITELASTGDTHGWHWDDYSFALVWVDRVPTPIRWWVRTVNERDALLDVSEQVLSQPGISISSLRASPAVIRSARNAGLIQAATVHSSSTGSHLLALIEEHTDLKVRIVIPPRKS